MHHLVESSVVAIMRRIPHLEVCLETTRHHLGVVVVSSVVEVQLLQHRVAAFSVVVLLLRLPVVAFSGVDSRNKVQLVAVSLVAVSNSRQVVASLVAVQRQQETIPLEVVQRIPQTSSARHPPWRTEASLGPTSAAKQSIVVGRYDAK